MMTPRDLKESYAQGENVTALLRETLGVDHNTQEIIEISYDIQAGSYIDAMNRESMATYKAAFTSELADIIHSLCEPVSILEAGVGEATTLSGVLGHMDKGVKSYGFDLSWSRLAHAKNWLHTQGKFNTQLCCGDLSNMPYLDNAIDLVYTSHSIEPNGGNEEAILRELYRVTRKYLILLEPGYELAGEEAKQRMDSHSYCKNLPGIAEKLGYHVVRHELFPYVTNPLNPTALTIISKLSDTDLPDQVLACPKFKTPLKEVQGALFSQEALVAYPILAGIPCLRIENGILASKFDDIIVNGSF